MLVTCTLFSICQIQNTVRTKAILKTLTLNLIVANSSSGSRNLLYKNNFRDNYTKIDFLRLKFTISMLPKIQHDFRGYLNEKIIGQLVPLIPEERRIFRHR